MPSSFSCLLNFWFFEKEYDILGFLLGHFAHLYKAIDYCAFEGNCELIEIDDWLFILTSVTGLCTCCHSGVSFEKPQLKEQEEHSVVSGVRKAEHLFHETYVQRPENGKSNRIFDLLHFADINWFLLYDYGT